MKDAARDSLTLQALFIPWTAAAKLLLAANPQYVPCGRPAEEEEEGESRRCDDGEKGESGDRERS